MSDNEGKITERWHTIIYHFQQLDQKAIQTSIIATVESPVNVSLKTLIEQQAAMSLNIDKFRNTFCDQLKNSTSILNHNVDVEQNSRGSSWTSSQEQLRPDIKRLGKVISEVSSSEDSDNSDDNNTLTHKSPKVNSHHRCVQSSTKPAYRDDDKVSIPDEDEMNRNLKDLQWEFDDKNSGKDWIDVREDDFKEIAQELNKEEGLRHPVQQTLANILETVWQNPQSYER